MTNASDYEEDYHANKDKKASRKEKKRLSEADRSKFKKTDQSPKKIVEVDPKALKGRVLFITGEGIWVDYQSKRYLCSLKGALKKEILHVKNLVIAGDFVFFIPTSEAEGVIIHVDDRFSHLARTDISGKKEQLIAANIDQVLIVVSYLDPPLKPALIDRYLIAATKGNLHPIIIVNKIDLLETSAEAQDQYREFLSAYEPLGTPILSVSSKTGTGIEALRSLMKDKTSVISGQSGVGKSSLLNAAFHMERRIGELASKTFKGAHTTTVAELITLPGGGYCIDTPGIRSFGVWELERREVTNHFTDLAIFAEHCHYTDCTHTTEPKCAVLCALKEGTLPLMRYESYSTLLSEVLGSGDNRSKKKEE